MSAEENPTQRKKKTYYMLTCNEILNFFQAHGYLSCSKFTVMIAFLNPQAQQPIDVKKTFEKYFYSLGSVDIVLKIMNALGFSLLFIKVV